MMTMTRAQPTLRTPPRRKVGSGHFDLLDPSQLSASAPGNWRCGLTSSSAQATRRPTNKS